ncbi:MAG: hypothetical protein DRH04_08220, partial [Deltaproteobacteria bacterium]
AVVIRNAGDGDITRDFQITIADTTTSYSVSDTFTNLGGTLPLTAGSSQTITVGGWNVGCHHCDYEITVTLDEQDDVCECHEGDNEATLQTTITLPDLVVDSADLAVDCAGDGRIRIRGPVTLRNNGCGDLLTGSVRMRFNVFDGPDCGGTMIDSFTRTFSGLSISANGGTEVRTIDVTRTLDLCDTCRVSIQVQADDNDEICECDGTNNDLCAGTFDIDYPDLIVTGIDTSGITCAADGPAGIVKVTVENVGCGDAGQFTLRLSSDGCLSFADKTVPLLAAGGSTTVDFPVSGTWGDCGDCSCVFTATADPDEDICECNGTNNALSETFTSVLPDLEISNVSAAIECAGDGLASVDADVTVHNDGCSDVASSFDVSVTLYDGANCSGSIVDAWSETIDGETIPGGGERTISLTRHLLTQALCAGDCAYSAKFEVDADNDICECDGTDNTFCLSSLFSHVPDLVVTEIDPTVDCRNDTAQVVATVENVGCGDATGVVLRLTSSCGLSIDSSPFDLAVGDARDVTFTYTPDCNGWNCTYTVVADPDEEVCECDGANSLTLDRYPGDGSIGDRIWFDLDGDGVQDAGEDGIPSVIVIIEGDLDNDGTIDYTAQVATDANGEYLFDGLPAGDYTISVDPNSLPEGLAQTYDYDGTATADTSEYTLAEDEDNRDQEFGYRGTGSIGDTVWFDVDGDGVQDAGEDGIPNVTVILEGDVDADGVTQTITTTTDADGNYLFDWLPAGPYTVTVDGSTLPDGLAQTYDADGLGTADSSDYDLAAGEDNREQDFGYSTPGLSVDKTIIDILRDGTSIGVSGPVEPGDIIVYKFVIDNVGPVPAYGVGFDDTLPPGVVIETDAPGDNGSYSVSSPAASGSLGLSDGVGSFTEGIDATIDGGGSLTVTFTAVVTSDIEQGTALTNTAHAFGLCEDGTVIPPENAVIGDTSDADAEDPDADDTGIATLSPVQPGLSVEKVITDIVRDGESIGAAGPVEPGDVVFYRFIIENVGDGTAYHVEFTDTLPSGMVTETDAPGSVGSYSVTSPAASGSLNVPDGATQFTTSIDATIAGRGTLTADFSAVVTSDIHQ